jgi:hypothetical protein
LLPWLYDIKRVIAKGGEHIRSNGHDGMRSNKILDAGCSDEFRERRERPPDIRMI